MKDHLINKIILLVGIIAVLGVASSSVVLSSPVSAQMGPEFIPGRYIVVLQDGVSPQDVIRGHGVVPDFVYSHALNGFSAPISPKLLDELKQDPRVVHIEQDQKVYAFSQTLPTGIDRIDAEPASSPSSFAGDVTVAIIDTGIDFDHPDLNVVHRADCAKKGPMNNKCFPNEGDDGNGHGTHVAGTVAAKDNIDGVVGVVPGADLWAVKVLKNDGSGWMSWIIAGVDYVTANAASVDVVNMSLGCECSSGALDTAISNSVAAGITYAVAAGNSAKDASTFSPANHDDVITVSAIADFDGKGGGQNDQTVVFSICTEDKDDSFACFSNFGEKIEIAAPGVSILSTYKDGGYATISGTSMASPHVAGAAAKLIAESATSLSPSDVLSGLLANGIKEGDPNYLIIDDDPDNIAEPIVYVGNTSVGDSPIVSIISPADGSLFHVGDNISFSGSASDTEDGDLTASLSWISSIDGAIGGGGGSFSTTLSEGSHTITASVTDSDGNSGSASISLSVVNDSPTTSITTPVDGSTFESGATILFEGSASDTEDGDLTASLSWISSIDGAIGGGGGSFSTTLSDGTHTITAQVTDSGGATASSSISITVGNPPAEATTVSVNGITYATEGGKNQDKHLLITVALVDDLGNLAAGASVSIDLFRDGSLAGSGTGTTGADGTVTFSLKNAKSGCYTTTVTDVTAEGLTWDGVTPANEFCK